MKNFKGYSLIELLISVALFGIVMISITSILASSSNAYKNETFEIKMQEDSSLVLAQLDELLIEATSFSIPSGNNYTIVNNGTTYNINYDGNNLSINGEVISDCVSDFSIGGWSTTTTSANCDNSVLVKLDLKKDDYTYKSEKQIYLRNNLENPKVHVLTSVTGTTTTTTTTSEPVLEVKRYAVINLKELYNKDSWSFGGSSGLYAYFTFCDASGNDSTTATNYIKLKDTVNTSYSSEVKKTDNIKISSGSFTVDLIVKPVQFKCGTGVIILPYKKTNNGAHDAYEVDGLDLYWCVKRASSTNKPKVKAVFYVDNNGDKKFTSGENGSLQSKMGGNPSDYNEQEKELKNFTLNSDGSISYNGDNMQFNNQFATIKVMGDYFAGGFVLNYPEVQPGDNGKSSQFTDGKVRLSLRFDIPGATDYYYVDYNVFCAGNNMQNNKGGNVYTVTK